MNFKRKYAVHSKLIEGFVDADWSKSYTGFCPVSWESKKQTSVALSSTETEYMAVSEAAKEAIFLKNLLNELGYSAEEAVTINIDIQGALKLA